MVATYSYGDGMAISKHVTLSDALYLQFMEWLKLNPEKNWNQFVREAIAQKLLIEEARDATQARS